MVSEPITAVLSAAKSTVSNAPTCTVSKLANWLLLMLRTWLDVSPAICRVVKARSCAVPTYGILLVVRDARSDVSSALIWFVVSAASPSLLMAARCRPLSATICVVSKDASWSVLSATNIPVPRVNICVVVRV